LNLLREILEKHEKGAAYRHLIDQAPGSVRDFVQGWFDGIEMIKNDPAASYAVVGKALDEATAEAAATIAVRGVQPLNGNRFKI
jgi:ABC-type nitrate/sulfonate/bicarbonate transport system substrate-binding protein